MSQRNEKKRCWKSRLAVLALLADAIVCGQSNQASVSGVITDSSGGVVPGASISLVQAQTDRTSEAISNDSGFYLISNLPVGSYKLTVTKPGFRKLVRDGLDLTTGQALGLDLHLELGQASDSVTVTGEVPLVETRTSDVTQLIEAKSIENLPLGNRRSLNALALTGAAVFVQYANTPGAIPNFSLAGGRTQSQMFWIDGGSGQNMRLGAGQINLDPPVETVEELKVLSNNNSAEYGGSAGGVIVITTRSGTNQLHGRAYEYLRNDLLDAPGFFAPVQGEKQKPKLRYNVFGGVVTGPVKHDKTFFLGAYEGQRLRTGGTDTLTVPSDLQRAGDFSQTFDAAGRLIPIYDPASTTRVNNVVNRRQFPGNRIPLTGIDPVAAKALTFYPRPNRTPDSITGANNFRSNYIVGPYSDFFMGKVDHSLTERDRLTARYLGNFGSSSLTSVYPDIGADPRTYIDVQQQYAYAGWTRAFNPTTVNDVRFTYTYRVAHAKSQGLGGGYPAKLGLTGIDADAFPQFAPAGFQAIGSAAQERRQFPIQQYQFVDNFSQVRGRHALKFGFEGRRSSNYEINRPTAAGAFSFSTQGTGLPGNAASGNGLATMLTGFVTGFTELETQVLDRSSWYWAAFAQDDWTVSKSLTLNLGVRWETDTPIIDANQRINGFDPLAVNPVSGTPGVVKFLGRNGFRSSPYDWDWNNFGPRLGFAWKPFGSTKSVVRGGYGIFFAHPFESGQPSAANLGFSVSASLNTPDNGVTAPFLLRNGVPVSGTIPVLDDSFGAVRRGSQPNTAVTFFDTNRPAGYSQQFNFGVQRELPWSSVLEAVFLGNLSRKLPNANLAINQIAPTILGPGHSSQADRPYPQFSNVSLIAPPTGSTNYYAGLLRFQKRYSHGVNLGATYTYSKFLGNVNDPGAELGDNAGTYSNLYDRRADYGPQPNDITHRFTLNFVYELPFGKGRRWLSSGWGGKIVGGWSVATLTSMQSGAPISVVTQTNNTNSFSPGAQRANVGGDPNRGPKTVAQWFDTAVFSQPGQFQFGNAGAGVVRAPGLINSDISLLRDFQIVEHLRMQFRGEFFNATNHTNLGLPGHTLGGAGFGVISGDRGARQIQAGVRILF